MPRPNWIDDTTSIPDAASLWRGVVPTEIRPLASGADRPSLGSLVTQELSVSIGSETTTAAVIAKGAKTGVTWRLWEFTAGDARRAGCIVDRDRLPDDPAHAVVLRKERPGASRITESQAKKLITAGRWVP